MITVAKRSSTAKWLYSHRLGRLASIKNFKKGIRWNDISEQCIKKVRRISIRLVHATLRYCNSATRVPWPMQFPGLCRLGLGLILRYLYFLTPYQHKSSLK